MSFAAKWACNGYVTVTAMLAGQHLLSAVVEQLIGADTVSWELHPRQTDSATADTVTIDLTVPDVTPEQITEIESRCNAHIRAAHRINIMWLDNSEKGKAERQRVIEEGNLRGKLPPDDVIQVTPSDAVSAFFLSGCEATL